AVTDGVTLAAVRHITQDAGALRLGRRSRSQALGRAIGAAVADEQCFPASGCFTEKTSHLAPGVLDLGTWVVSGKNQADQRSFALTRQVASVHASSPRSRLGSAGVPAASRCRSIRFGGAGQEPLAAVRTLARLSWFASIVNST